ncbi:MAG: lysophospholipid acyltransferase family protein [Comamonas sp.]|jgi:KDO2-lipid IV(A) lauroyltransferase|uniref:lysophospholipid acyltransferase family protein n=1 Tax=Comamonas sp. TaxID=34028 RepID=UPI00282A4C03|nr:lysophospholipid acyltransferase family protein [Comamonas sp.]MDR0213529.1 lysophospholipid acyltransferase family protein [Comamonas sp.]
MPSLFRLFAALPLWLLHGLGAAMGWLILLLSPTYRRRFVANAAQAGYGFGQVKAAVGHAGRMVFEMPRIWLGQLPPCNIVGGESAEKAYGRGKGIVFLTPHLGCFEMSVQAAAQRWSAAHGDITVLYRPARQAWLAEILETARNRPGVQAVPTTLSGVRQMIKALRQGAAVGLLPDQVPPNGLGVWSPFFGRDAYTMTLAARLVLQTGATVIVARCERKSWGRGYTLYLEELPVPESQTLETTVQLINEAMEAAIRQCPQQYLWGYGRYKQPREEKPQGDKA